MRLQRDHNHFSPLFQPKPQSFYLLGPLLTYPHSLFLWVNHTVVSDVMQLITITDPFVTNI